MASSKQFHDVAGSEDSNKRAVPADRVPMSVPRARLEVPDIPGYSTYWFRGEPGRLQRAFGAGYEFVHPDEIELNNFDLAGSMDFPGGSDLGDRVSIPAQDGAGPDGQYLRLYLMKIKQEYRDQDQAEYEVKMIDPIVDALKGGQMGAVKSGENPTDQALRYQRNVKLPDMFTKKPPK